MKNNRPIYLIIAGLAVWILILSILVYRHHEVQLPNEISEYNVSGFSTDLSKVYDENKSSIVAIEQGSTVSTGFIYAQRDGNIYIITTYHGISGSSDINIHFNNGVRVKGTVIDRDAYADLALIESAFDYEVRPVTCGNSSLSKTGEFILSIGSAGSLEYDFSSQFGMISSKYREIENSITHNGSTENYYLGMMQLSGEFTEGYSGSPLFNMNGEAIAMITMEDEGIVFGLPINELKMIADKMLNGESHDKIQLGISGRYLSDLEKYETVSLNINVEIVNGYYVENVRPGSLGSSLGIQRGDLITSINSMVMENSDSMLNVLYGNPEELEIVLIRNGEEIVLRSLFD